MAAKDAGARFTAGIRYWAVLALAAAALASCTTALLVRTTGEEGIVEDPTRRTPGVRLDDQRLELKISVNMQTRFPAFRDSHFRVFSHNGVVLLVGQVETEAMRARAEAIAIESSVNNSITRIHNELEVRKNTGFMRRNRDRLIAARVRVKDMFASSDVPPQVRVIVENGAVYLMGLVTEEQGKEAEDVVKKVSGVKKVVKVFEYIPTG